ncbi:MAG: methylenetetrahydrofolate--tRNA-(uracil(54)-C(5))-methyltransferase (FADH(2)-oxidizing) TrmFO [Anaerolineaceae bacterium]|nr:methylenetetrahydrofolate--tRNA-(uracil(54)-C(5))-methyltransferase (FADH(2)-oxidizing) TrmFO [Anaerolineaceae bacterium]
MEEKKETLTIIGAGLAGCEAAWQAANRGISVSLYEMRPEVSTGAHTGGDLGELVCSNSLGSNLKDRASGVLKEELRLAGSLLVNCAETAAVPAGNALAVDRKIFSREIEKHIINHPNITLIRKEVRKIPDDGTVIIASGPLSSPAISDEIKRLCGTNNLFFFDAIAPIVEHSSINLNIAYEGSRYSKDPDDTGDYINCPFTKEEYETFVEALVNAERIPLKSFEEAINSGVTAGKKTFFEGCLPVEVLAARSVQSLAFGPMRPVGLIDPRTGKRPWAVLQLRQDNLSGSLYNLVGFQTNLLQKEQERVFRMIPGLENAQFIRYGQMHRNTYICAPGVLNASLQMINHPSVFFAGQLCGVEGYMGNIAAGLLAGINAARQIKGDDLLVLPKEMISGALFHYISTAEAKHFQPMKANFGILPPLSEKIRSKRERYVKYSERALENAALFFKENDC